MKIGYYNGIKIVLTDQQWSTLKTRFDPALLSYNSLRNTYDIAGRCICDTIDSRNPCDACPLSFTPHRNSDDAYTPCKYPAHEILDTDQVHLGIFNVTVFTDSESRARMIVSKMFNFLNTFEPVEEA